MASTQFAAVYGQIGRLFRSGTSVGLTEGQLLDRFVSRRDDDAFEAIVARHGPMVLGVCRALLRDPNDVDDAFQAVFLVLIKKAGGLQQRDLLGNWLYGVAHRVARRTRADTAKRRERDLRSRVADRFESYDPDLGEAEVPESLHTELDRLPASYRSVIVLCYLQGRTHEDAARELGWPIGTVKGRLARAKELLRGRLVRRGFAPSTGLVSSLLIKEGQAAIPPTLLASTVKVATATATGTPLATVFAVSALTGPPRVFILSQGVIETMSLVKCKFAATFVVGAGVLAGPAVSAYQAGGESAQIGKAVVEHGSAAPKAKISPPVGGGAGTARSPSPGLGDSRSVEGLGTVPDDSYYAQVIKRLPPNVPPPPRNPGAETRYKLAAEAIASLKNPKDARPKELADWEGRLDQAVREIEGSYSSYFQNQRNLEAAQNRERDLKADFERGKVSKVVLLDAQFQRMEAEAQAKAYELMLPRLGLPAPPARTPEKAANLGGMPGGTAGVSTRPPNTTLQATTPQNPGGLMMGMTGDPSARRMPTSTPTEHPADVARNKAIEEKLEKVVAMNFPQDTPLADVLKYIKEVTADEKGKTIPIYIDPKGLAEAEKTLDSPVTMDLEDVPLRTTLRLLLRQIDLDYTVRDGLVLITSKDGMELEPTKAKTAKPPSEPGLMGSGGVKGGGFGGGFR